jgi:hypothetical protein
MAKRLRDVCALPESEPLWRAGRGFVVRDLPWTVEKLRVIPPFEFENWAVIALGTSRTRCRWAKWAAASCRLPESKLNTLPHPGLLPTEKEKRAPRLWQNRRRDWPDGRSSRRKRAQAVPSPRGRRPG